MADLTDVITDAVNDASIPDSSDVEVDTPEVEASPVEDTSAEIEASTEEPASAEVTEPEEDTSSEVQSPAAREVASKEKLDDLASIAPTGIGGRENRIPYSRVKKITEKAVNEIAEVALGRKLNPGEKAVDVVKSHVARIPELETKVTDYESRLTQVGEFENVMQNQPQRFLQMLAQVPAYREFFDFVENALNSQQGQVEQPAQAQQASQTPVGDDMPEPNEELPDGTKVYNMEGLKSLLAWNAKQVEARVSKQFEDRYKPIEADWQERRRIEATLPVIRAKIAEAKTWPLFNENEEDITKALAADPKLSLEGAYQKVVMPKLIAERNTVRKDVLQEIKKAPVATSVGTRVASKPNPPAAGPRSLEDIIRESVATIKR